jgi:amino acid adenylation domain-containing protein
MPEIANLEPVASGPSAAANAQHGFVQLPTDSQRSSAIGYRRAFTGARPLQRSIGDPAAALVGALCAVLFRYGQQDSIDLELHACQPDSSRRRSVMLCCPVTSNASMGDVVARAEMGMNDLRVVMPDEPSGEARSNIAVSFVDGGDARGNLLSDSDQYDVHVIVCAEPSAFEIAYNARLFEPATIDRLANALLRVFEVSVARPETTVAKLPVLSPGDLQTITVEWDSGHAEYPQEPVHRVFERVARQQPDALAVRFEEQSLTYGELDARSNRLAHHLRASGVMPGGAVAVCVLPSLDIVVAFLAIWKAGAVYVPLDPTHPEALIATILDEVQPGLVLTQSKLSALTNPAQHVQFCFDTDWHRIESLPASAPAVKITLDDSAHVLYTSGTTGKPKGVDARHGNLAHYIHVAQQAYGFGPSDVFCSLARYTFSISLFELLSPLCCGGSLRLLTRDDVLAPNRLANWLDDVTVIHAGPSLLGNLFRYLRTITSGRQTFGRMRHASSGGDLVPPTVIDQMKHVFPNAELFVIYGCTEVSCMGCTYPIRRDRNVTRTFVGKPFPDVVARVTDPAGNIVPFGAVGEICFAGKGVVHGYLHRLELTVEKFAMRRGVRFYQTGDMGRLHPDGNIEILGRRDYQVQLRGIRVELPGIENTVRGIGLAEQCAVVMKTLSDQDVRLIAFVTKPRETTIAGFRRALAAHLPDYMLPQAMVVVDALPLTRNGKLDRNALQALPWESTSSGVARTAPRDALEIQIAEAFARALGVAEVGIDDDFFDSGGHSLLAVSLLLELEKALGVTLSPGVIFERPTVRAIAEMSQGSDLHVVRPIPLSADRDKPPLFVLLGVQLYRGLAKRLEGHYSVFGVYSGRELVNLETSEPFTITELAGDYIQVIRQHQPKGPYRLVGMSFGGIAAFEVAQQLRAAGEEVAFIGMIDATLPESGIRYRLSRIARAFSLSPRTLLRIGTDRLRMRFPRLFQSQPKSDYIRYAMQDRVSGIEQHRLSIYRDASFDYAPHVQHYPGKIELIAAGRRLARDPLLSPELGWRRHVASRRLQVLDGDHFDLIEEPLVATVAEIFLQALAPANNQDAFDRAEDAAQDLELSEEGLLTQ